MKVITQIYLIRAQAEVSIQRQQPGTTCFLLQSIYDKNSLMIKMEMWVIIIFYLGHIKQSSILYFRTTLLLEQHRSL